MKKLIVAILVGSGALAGGWALAEVTAGDDDEAAPEPTQQTSDDPAANEEGEAADDTENAEEATPEAEATAEEARPEAEMPRDVAGFVEAMREQIMEAGHTPTCVEAGRCSYTYEAQGDRTQEVQLWYAESSKTIYVFAPWVATATQTNAATPLTMRHLAALNRLLSVARFEWSSESGEVRLGAVMNVDSNFDGPALRSLLAYVQEAVNRYAQPLSRLLSAPEDAPSPPRPPTTDSTATVNDAHNYMDAIEQELTALGARPTCDAQRGRCTYELDSTAARNVFSMVIEYDPTRATVTAYADRFLSAPTDNPRSEALLQRVMELNWENLAPMYQWDARAEQLRLAATLNTDSNFDRRAFRGVVAALHQTAERHYRDLRGILNP